MGWRRDKWARHLLQQMRSLAFDSGQGSEFLDSAADLVELDWDW